MLTSHMKSLGLAALATGIMVSACQERLVADEREPFGAGVVRMGDKEVARVNGTLIYASDVESAAMTQGLIGKDTPFLPSDPNFASVLEELIDQRLLALDALGQSLDQQDETRRRLLAARERILGSVRVEEHLREKVNATTIRRMYDEQATLAQRGPERRARHILLADEEAAKAVFKALEDGADFKALAAEKSTDTGSASNGGDLSYFSRDMLEKTFTSKVFAAEIGDRIPPFETEFGWHVVEVLGARTPPQKTFEELRPELVNFMTFEAIQSLLTDLREDGDVAMLIGPKAKVEDPNQSPEIEETRPDE